MEKRDRYAEVFMIVWEQIEEEGKFSESERSLGYEPVKAKIYGLIDAGETDELKIITTTLSWFRDRTQIDQSADRIMNDEYNARYS
jgi:hypothetical protein